MESLLTKSMQITQARNAKTLTPSHMKQCILSESRFDFLKDLVKNIPDASTQEDNENNAIDALDYSNYMKSEEEEASASDTQNHSDHSKAEIVANFYTEQSTSAGRTPVIQYSPKISTAQTKTSMEPKINITVDSAAKEPKIHINLSNFAAPAALPSEDVKSIEPQTSSANSIVHPSAYGQNSGDNLYIDEDYDN